jgi:hypothetical protein
MLSGGMLRSAVLSFSFLTLACGEATKIPDATPVPEPYVEPDLQPYLDLYLDQAARAGAPVRPEYVQELRRIEWSDESDLSEGHEMNLGNCHRFNSNSTQEEQRFRTIRVARLQNIGLSPSSRKGQVMLKAILYHEFGHCLHDFHGHRPVEDQVIMSAELPEHRFSKLSELISEHFHMMP